MQEEQEMASFPDIQSIDPCYTDRDDRLEEYEQTHVWESRLPTVSIVKSWVTTSFGRITTSFGRIAVVWGESYLAAVKKPFENHRR